MRVLQRSLGARRTWRAWTAGTRLLRTCCSPKWSAPTLMRREAQTTCLSSQTTTATPRTWGDVSVCSPPLFHVLPGLYLSFSPPTVSQWWCADSVLATRLMSARCSFLQHPAGCSLLCQRGALKLQGSSPQPRLTSPQAMVSITTQSSASDTLWEF